VDPSDVSTRYFAETGEPLVTAIEAADMCGVQVRTIYQWVRRNRLTVLGLADDGVQLFGSTDVARLIPLTRRKETAAWPAPESTSARHAHAAGTASATSRRVSAAATTRRTSCRSTAAATA
jgi:hypothetical protein